MTISFFDALMYSFAMIGAILGVIPLLGYFKISIHWINELYAESWKAPRVFRFNMYYFVVISYHLLLLLGTLAVMTLTSLGYSPISQETFGRIFLSVAFAGSANLLVWVALFCRISQERITPLEREPNE